MFLCLNQGQFDNGIMGSVGIFVYSLLETGQKKSYFYLHFTQFDFLFLNGSSPFYQCIVGTLLLSDSRSNVALSSHSGSGFHRLSVIDSSVSGKERQYMRGGILLIRGTLEIPYQIQRARVFQFFSQYATNTQVSSDCCSLICLS